MGDVGREHQCSTCWIPFPALLTASQPWKASSEPITPRRYVTPRRLWVACDCPPAPNVHFVSLQERLESSASIPLSLPRSVMSICRLQILHNCRTRTLRLLTIYID